jgi:hypothetical protein
MSKTLTSADVAENVRLEVAIKDAENRIAKSDRKIAKLERLKAKEEAKPVQPVDRLAAQIQRGYATYEEALEWKTTDLARLKRDHWNVYAETMERVTGHRPPR